MVLVQQLPVQGLVVHLFGGVGQTAQQPKQAVLRLQIRVAVVREAQQLPLAKLVVVELRV
jgi:hypothetical protein